MLTDIFAARYAKRTLWEQCTETETRLLTQCFRIIAEQLIPYYDAKGQESETGKKKWKTLHDNLSLELGLNKLAPKGYSFQSTVMANHTRVLASGLLTKSARTSYARSTPGPCRQIDS